MGKVFISMVTENDTVVVDIEKHCEDKVMKISFTESESKFKEIPLIQNRIASTLRLCEVAKILTSVDVIRQTISEDNTTTSINS